MKKEEMMLKATQMLAKGKFKLKKAGPTIMIVGAAIGGVTAAVLACKATLKAEEIIAEHNAQVETIHATKAQVDSGEMQLKDGETYTADDMKKDITATYVHTAVWLAKIYAPAVTLGSLSLACMFGSHHIMSRRNASSDCGLHRHRQGLQRVQRPCYGALRRPCAARAGAQHQGCGSGVYG
ncbi:MAG: DUF6353 family protein [Faecalibacterium prausnitzii]